MKNYVEFQRVQTVRVPIEPGVDWIDARNVIKDGEMFDHDLFDFDKEEVIEEDYSHSDEKYRVVFDGQIKADFMDSGTWQFVYSRHFNL